MGHTLLAAASTTDNAMADSTRREGSEISPSAAIDKVIECANVKDVTTHSTSRHAWPKRTAPRQSFSVWMSTAGNNRDSRNKMWSNPIQMCQTPSTKYR